MLTTTVAMWFILRGKVQQHRQWMTRSFACSIIFIEVRAIVGITGWDKYIETVIWCCVVAAVPLADLVLQWQDSRRGPAVSARAGEIAQQRRAAAVS